ncbi:MAG: hypothetical protein M0R06_07455 [Sphaerochaeta sp.]|jgi:hypothetical protein|nr:hypothetical protein [Sphaerochaeta sp.]
MNDEEVCKQESKEGSEIDRMMREMNLTDESLMNACNVEKSRQENKMRERHMALRAGASSPYMAMALAGAFLAILAIFEVIPAPFTILAAVVGSLIAGSCSTRNYYFMRVRREALSIDTDRVRGGGLM